MLASLVGENTSCCGAVSNNDVAWYGVVWNSDFDF